MKETEEYYNQKILCDVTICKYHDNDEDRCTLGKIKVSTSDGEDTAFCESFESEE